jgi:hypothetical protein
MIFRLVPINSKKCLLALSCLTIHQFIPIRAAPTGHIFVKSDTAHFHKDLFTNSKPG